jgi:phage anti-repressor protein
VDNLRKQGIITNAMNGLSQFQTNDDRIVYPARKLYDYLGSERKFTNWFKYQIYNCNLIEDKD